MHLALLLAAGLSAQVALAGPYADELASMDATLADLQAMRLPADGKAAIEVLRAGVRDLEQLGAQAEAAGKAGSANHRVCVLTRLAEGYVAFFSALLDAPCPDGLTGESCDLYRGTLAERVAAFGESSEKLERRIREELIVAGSGNDKLRGKETRRAKAAQAQLAVLRGLADAAAPGRPETPVLGALALPSEVSFGSPGGAVAHAPAPLPPRDDADAKPHAGDRYVQLRKTATLTSGEEGGGVQLVPAAAPGEGPVPETLLARLLDTRGSRVLLELGAGDHRFHCHYDVPWEKAVRVYLWADLADLHPVTTGPVERSFPDGSGVALRPGALVVEEGVWADGLLLPLDLPEDAVGVDYPESDAFGERPEGVSVLVGEAAMLSLGARRLPRPPASYRDDGLVWTDSVGPGEDGVVGFHSACGQITPLAAAQRDPDLNGGGGLGGIFGSGPGTETRYRIPAGTALTWPDGGPAGVLAGDIVRMESDFPAKPDGRRCFDQAVDWLDEGEADWPERHLELCVAP
jgi:hypothetical protein